MYTITITDLITKDETEVCNVGIDDVEEIIANLSAALPHYLEVDFKEAEGVC